MGSFEDSIKKAFEEKGIKAPHSAWSKVENSLNADFVFAYQSKQSRYKWIAAAAILIAVFSLAFQYSPIYDSGSDGIQAYSGESYNALLEKNTDYSTGLSFGNGYFSTTVFAPITNTGGNEVEQGIGLVREREYEIRAIRSNARQLASLSPSLEIATVDWDIYRYHQGGSYSSLSSARNQSEKKLWAGVEAGAGNFSSSLSSSNVFAGSINQSNLASAVGSDGFVNPSTRVNPDLNSGIATSVGVDLGMRLGNRWAFETGIAYTNVDSRGDATINVLDIYTVNNNREFFGTQNATDLPIPSSSRETSFEVQDSYDHDVDLQSNLRFTSIPLKAGYFVMDRKMSLRLNVGFAANYFIGSQVRAQNDVLNGSIDDSFNSWSFDGLGGVEIGYSIFDNFDLTFEPNYRQSITPITNSNSSESRFLVQTGLRYRIQ